MSSKFLCKKNDIPENGFKVFDIENGKVMVANSDKGYYAYDGFCPHQEVCLAEGLYDGKVFTCHEHLWQWDIVSGDPLGLAESPLVVKKIEEIDDELHLLSN
jgi:toluene monooxygenase system ferredoxin subunit